MKDQTIKSDEGKLELSLVPTQAIKDIAEVRMYGRDKYGDSESWRKVDKVRYIDALYRHLLAYIDDNKSVDEESGLPHIKHMACNIAFLCHMEASAEQPKRSKGAQNPTRQSGEWGSLESLVEVGAPIDFKILQDATFKLYCEGKELK